VQSALEKKKTREGKRSGFLVGRGPGGRPVGGELGASWTSISKKNVVKARNVLRNEKVRLEGGLSTTKKSGCNGK